jgi:hypothetical protein
VVAVSDLEIPAASPCQLSGEQLGARGGEFHVGAGLMFEQPSLRDGAIEAGTGFGGTSAFTQKRQIVRLHATVHDGFDGIGEFNELARGLFGVGEQSVSGEFHA